MRKIIKLFFQGVAYGCTMSIFTSLIIAWLNPEGFSNTTVNEFLKQPIYGMITGVFFFVPSIIYEKDNLPVAIQTLVHMGIGLTVNFIVAFNAGWIPVGAGLGPIIITMATFVIGAFIIWYIFYLMAKKEAKLINERLRNREN